MFVPSSLLGLLLTTLPPHLAALNGLPGHHHHHSHHTHRGDLAHAPAVATIDGDSKVTISLADTDHWANHLGDGQKDSNEAAAPGTLSDAFSAAQSSLTLMRRSRLQSHRTLQYSVFKAGRMPQARGVMLVCGLMLLAGFVGGGFASLALRFADARDKAAQAIKKEDSAYDDPPEATNAHLAADSPILPAQPAPPPMWKVVLIVVGHSICATMLTIFNKKALTEFHPPATAVSSKNASYLWTLVVIQFGFAALVAFVAGAIGLCDVTPLQLRKAISYFPAAGMFTVTIVAGNAVMNFSNVNAFLVLRSLVPLPCSLAEALVYKESMPSPLSGIALLVTIGGALGYALSVGGIEIYSIVWAVTYLVVMPIDALLIKHSISSLNISPWGLVFYNNLLAAIPALCCALVFEVPSMQSFLAMVEVLTSHEARGIVLISCALGVAMSYFQLRTRYFISATAFMVLGIFNKFATVFANIVLNEDTELMAIICILVCVCGAIGWQFTVKGGSVKVREGKGPMDRTIVISFAAACAALMLAVSIEWSQVMGEQ